MGLRLRKSINLGGGFRINLSKSGVGYSWGTKGYRISKTARGTTRRSVSIPGTGIGWVTESGKGRKRSTGNGGKSRNNPRGNGAHFNNTPSSRTNSDAFKNPSPIQNQNSALINSIKSAEIEDFKEAEEGNVSDAIERAILMNSIGMWLLCGIILMAVHPAFLIIPVIGIALIIISHTSGRVGLEYCFDPEKQDEHNRRIGAWQLLAEGKKEWQVIAENRNGDNKVNGGANRLLKRVLCKIEKKKPFYIDTNVDIISISLSNKESLLILPDKVFFVRNKKVGAIDYSDFNIRVSSVRYIETETLPSDAQVVEKTWQYVNKNGTPDRRYKNNRELPICLYGQILLRSSSGLNIELMISNNQNAKDFAELIL